MGFWDNFDELNNTDQLEELADAPGTHRTEQSAGSQILAALKSPPADDKRDKERDIDEEDFEVEPDIKQNSRWKSNPLAEL